MATVADESSSSRSLMTELFSGAIYKGRQGRIVRQLTCIAIWLLMWFGAWQLFELFRGGFFESARNNTGIVYGVPAAFALLGTWFGFRIVNWPKFADFLISVESEMTKVSWPTRNELYRASIVVIFTMATLAVLLFTFDLVWQAFFEWIRVS